MTGRHAALTPADHHSPHVEAERLTPPRHRQEFRVLLADYLAAARAKADELEAIQAHVVEVFDESRGRATLVAPRWTIRRLPVGTKTVVPWQIKDATRPDYLGTVARQDWAIRAIDSIMRLERERQGGGGDGVIS